MSHTARLWKTHTGYVAECSCGWSSPLCAVERSAKAEHDKHVEAALASLGEDAKPYRKNRDPASSHAAALHTVEREGGSRTIRRDTHKYKLLLVYVNMDCEEGLTVQEAGDVAIKRWPESFNGQIPKRDAARRAEDIAKMGLLDRLDDGSHYRVNELGRRVRTILRTQKEYEVE